MFTVQVPATSANLGPGFDTLGLALDLFLNVKVKEARQDITVYYTVNNRQKVSINPDNNLIVKAMQKVFEQMDIYEPSFVIRVENNIPIGRGLGSSAAAIVAGMYAANKLIGDKFSTAQLMKWAVGMEGHADNIVPAIVGGLTTAMVYENEVYYQKVDLPNNFNVIVAVPDFKLPTQKSRAVLPEKIALQDTIYNLQRACFLLASLHNADFRHLNLAMDDMIYQPLRKQFIPGFDEVFSAAYANGALGVAMSGAGPSVIAFANRDLDAIGSAMREAFLHNKLACNVYNLAPNTKGVRVI